MKKLIPILLALVLLLSACGKKSSASTDNAKPTSTPKPTPAATVATAQPEKTENKPVVIYAADMYEGYGFYHQQAEASQTLVFAPIGDENAAWKVYILDDEFEDAERYIPQAYKAALEGSGKLEIYEGQWLYIYCPYNEWTTEKAPEGSGISWIANPEAIPTGTPVSYKLDNTGAANTSTSEVKDTAEASGTVSKEVKAIKITKNPTEETIPKKGRTLFIAAAKGADSVEWFTIDKDNNYHTLAETRSMFPGIKLQYQEGGNTLFVGNVPDGFSGWRLVARYKNSTTAVETEPVYLFVEGVYD